MEHTGHGEQHRAHAHHHEEHFGTPEVAATAELEGEVLVGLAEQAVAVLRGLTSGDGRIVERVVDLGCGPGVGTCLLAASFPDARVVAADGSPAMLERAAARAARLGVADRVELRHVELPDGIEAIGRADLVWASMVLHHVDDRVAVLTTIRELLEPGGLVALVERAEPTRVLPDEVDLGRPGLWDRIDAAWLAWFAEAMPSGAAGEDHARLLEDAGFRSVSDHELRLVLDPPLDDAARQFALRQVGRARHQLVEGADPADLAALEVLGDESADGSILRRADATVRTARHLYTGRAPG
jgi:SAM-dependent methyltransferase